MTARPRPRETWFQRAIVAFHEQTKEGKTVVVRVPDSRAEQATFYRRSRDLERVTIGAELSCGHVAKYERRRPGGSRRKTMPCRECGSVERARYAMRQHASFLRFALQRAIAHPGRSGALVEFVAIARTLTTFSPPSPEVERLYERLARSANEAGLDATREDEAAYA